MGTVQVYSDTAYDTLVRDLEPNRSNLSNLGGTLDSASSSDSRYVKGVSSALVEDSYNIKINSIHIISVFVCFAHHLDFFVFLSANEGRKKSNRCSGKCRGSNLKHVSWADQS